MSEPHATNRRLAEMFGLPKRTIWFELRAAVNEVPRVRCEYYVDESTAQSTVAEFSLVEQVTAPGSVTLAEPGVAVVTSIDDVAARHIKVAP